jgi:heme-degrading monooxygenase HmoA
MMTIVTHVHLNEGAGQEWDAAMRTRLAAARKRAGWVGGQLLRPDDKAARRVIIGTWKTRGDWEAWHHDPRFATTRQRFDALESGAGEHWWHEVVLDVRSASPAPRPAPKAAAARASKAKRKNTPRRSS